MYKVIRFRQVALAREEINDEKIMYINDLLDNLLFSGVIKMTNRLYA
jgi:hypothetical protein